MLDQNWMTEIEEREMGSTEQCSRSGAIDGDEQRPGNTAYGPRFEARKTPGGRGRNNELG